MRVAKFCLFVVLVTAATTPFAANLLVNGSFSGALAPWSPPLGMQSATYIDAPGGDGPAIGYAHLAASGATPTGLAQCFPLPSDSNFATLIEGLHRKTSGRLSFLATTFQGAGCAPPVSQGVQWNVELDASNWTRVVVPGLSVGTLDRSVRVMILISCESAPTCAADVDAFSFGPALLVDDFE